MISYNFSYNRISCTINWCRHLFQFVESVSKGVDLLGRLCPLHFDVHQLLGQDLTLCLQQLFLRSKQENIHRHIKISATMSFYHRIIRNKAATTDCSTHGLVALLLNGLTAKHDSLPLPLMIKSGS